MKTLSAEEIQKYHELVEQLDSDFERFPLPICFDPQEEQRELWRRTQQIEKEAKRQIQSLITESEK